MTETTTRTLEEAYFHISNSGVTLSVTEAVTRYDDTVYYRHHLDAVLSAFGTPLKVQVPLMSATQVQWLADALARTAEHMRTLPVANRPYITRDREDPNEARLEYMAGYRVEEVWTPETVTSRYGTETRHVANRMIDPATGAVVAVVAVTDGRCYSSGTDGSRPLYAETAVGKAVDTLTPEDRGVPSCGDAEDFWGCDPDEATDEVSVADLQAQLKALEAQFDAVAADAADAVENPVLAQIEAEAKAEVAAVIESLAMYGRIVDESKAAEAAKTEKVLRTVDPETEGKQALAALIEDMTAIMNLPKEEGKKLFEQQQAAHQEAEAERTRRQVQDDMAALREQLGQDFTVVMGYDPDAVPSPAPLTEHQKEVREMRRLANLTRDGLAGKPVTAEQRAVVEMRKTMDVTKAVSLYPFGQRGDRG